MLKTTRAEQPTLSGMKFLVEEVLGADGDGKVMRISDRDMPGKLYALKVVNREEPSDDAKLERCRASAEASSKLKHPAILMYHDYRVRKSWFRVVRSELLMEYVAGKSLDKLEGKLKLKEWVLIFKHVAEALAHMHRRGVMHGDLTPARVLLSDSGVVKLIGYGQSLLKEKSHLTLAKQFAAPERVRESIVDERTETYSLGTLMYYLLTGKTPNALRNRGEDEAVKVPKPSALNPMIPVALNDLILRCVQRQPASRPEGMFNVVKSLEDLASAMKLDEGMLRGVGRPDEA